MLHKILTLSILNIAFYGMTAAQIATTDRQATTARTTLNISDGWQLWPDKMAEWENDSLYLPNHVDLDKLAASAPTPTGGWGILEGTPSGAVTVNLPAMADEYFSPDGKVETFVPGVYWFWKEVEIPVSFKEKHVTLNIESARLRAEIYVNERLVGYDIVGETPYSCDLSSALRFGQKNRIAIRITNPGGAKRWWGDGPLVTWGRYHLPFSRNFGGITGEIFLTASDLTFIDDIYVKNLNTADFRSIGVEVTIKNLRNKTVKALVHYEIVPAKGGPAINTATQEIEIPKLTTTICGLEKLSCQNAELWNINSPNLYKCNVSIFTDKVIDDDCESFGFRVFEVKQMPGQRQAHYYVNGKRIIFRGGIDFSYYAYTGAYATREMAERSVLSAKELGQNGFSFHRHIGLSPVLRAADELGLFLYEEVGGFHIHENHDLRQYPFAEELEMVKLFRMVMRDRSHPSLLIYNLCNEDNEWCPIREEAMRMVHSLDDARLVVNSSGGNGGQRADGKGYEGGTNIPHIRPYEKQIRTDFFDEHTVGAAARFEDKDFNIHKAPDNANIKHWGEVKCYPAPENWYLIYKMLPRLKAAKSPDYKGYNYAYYNDFGQTIANYFDEHKMNGTGSGAILTPADIPRATGGGKMYDEGRNAQNIMSYDASDAYVINAWSGGTGLDNGPYGEGWFSGMVDDGRNIKGDPAIFAYYVRPSQIVIQRKTADDGTDRKFFDPDGRVSFVIRMINHGIVAPGNGYTLQLRLKDGAGAYHSQYNNTIPVTIADDNAYAFSIDENYTIRLNDELHGGYLTLEATLYDANGTAVADGAEQIMLSNRQSFAAQLKPVAVFDWPEAKNAIKEAKGKALNYAPNTKCSYIAAAGNPSPRNVEDILENVKQGATLLVKFDSIWAERFFEKGILSARVTEWGAPQSGGWSGNGFGYIDYWTGPTGLNDCQIVSTSGWEIAGDANAFAPFKCDYPTIVYGVYLARPDVLRTIIGLVRYGKGCIILNPAYPVDDRNPFNDLIFYNMLSMKVQ